MPPPPPRSEIDHTERPSLTHTAPPGGTTKNTEFFCGGEGVVDPPLPCSDCEEILVEELLLFDWSIEYKSTEKINKYD